MKDILKILTIFIVLVLHCVKARNRICNGEFIRKDYVCCGGLKKFVGRPGGGCCKSEGFLPSSQICCGDKVFSKKNVNTGCCYGKYYQRGEKSCCGKILIDIKTHGCCRNEPFKRDYEDCCDGERVPNYSINSTAPQQCCGRILHNVITHQCCAEKVAPRVAGEHTKCCQETTYDSRIEDCCNREVIEKEKGKDQCCHGKMIDSRKQICCNYQIMDKIHGSDTGCCRLALYHYTMYNTRRQICCSRELRDRIPKWKRFDPVVASRISCCNKYAYDTDKQICCGLRVHNRNPGMDERCCGSRAYDRSKYICCDRYKWRLNSRYEFCCGKYKYDRRKYECKLVNKEYKRVPLNENEKQPQVTEKKKDIDIFVAKTQSPYIDPFVDLIPKNKPSKRLNQKTKPATSKSNSGPAVKLDKDDDIPAWALGVDWSKIDSKKDP